MTRLALLLAIGLAPDSNLAASAAPQASPPATRSAPGDAIEQLLDVPHGLTTVKSLVLPREFVMHVADREIRAQFRSTQRRVIADPPSPPTADEAITPPDDAAHPPGDAAIAGLTVKRIALDPALIDRWTSYSFAVPNLRGFRAAMLRDAADPWPFDVLPNANAERDRQIATFVAERLAMQGLPQMLVTLMTAIDLQWTIDGRLSLPRFRAVGVPIDLIDHFMVDQRSLDATLATWYDAGASTETAAVLLQRVRFEFKPSAPGFTAMAEDGSEAIGAFRVQLPFNRFARGEGDGSVLDVFRQLLARDDGPRIITSIHEAGVDELLDQMSEWDLSSEASCALVSHPANITQWAQDNAKSGTVNGRAVMLVPRYASTGELRTTFAPSESFICETLGRADRKIVQSPLLFQGGNLLPYVDPRDGQRVLLVGEAEIHRNRALGLSAAEVVEAFRREFGVARCVVLQGPSFHIDLDFTIRRCGERAVACINDDLAGSAIVARLGVEAMQRGGALSSVDAASIQGQLDERQMTAVTALWAAITPLANNDGSLGERFTSMFAGDDETESGAANAARFLAAIDMLTSTAIDLKKLDATSPRDQALRSYMIALRRQRLATEALAKRLGALGLAVVRVPGLGDHAVSMNYVNGIHVRDRYLMPSFGGMMSPLDDAARNALRQAFGEEVIIEPIRAAAMQGHDGGLHCLLGLMPE